MTTSANQLITIRRAELKDSKSLVSIEQSCFVTDRLSERSFRHHIRSTQSDLFVIERKTDSLKELLGYGLVFCHKGTRLARLYSLAILPTARGGGLAQQLLAHLESTASDRGKHYMRLEVATHNHAAIALYRTMGYSIFGEYSNYYEDHSDALRMQKQVRKIRTNGISRSVNWYQQSTEFTCGPASLMMAMASIDENVSLSQELEIDIWREATTVFMTSGHGGTHPLGLALAAAKRGFQVAAYLNSHEPPFIDGVRSEKKKQIMHMVHQQFLSRCLYAHIPILYQDINQSEIKSYLEKGCAILSLISTYRLDGKKAPHWVVITGIDDDCLFVHDPDIDEKTQQALDCQHIPIARDDFDKMSSFGSGKLRSSVIIQPR